MLVCTWWWEGGTSLHGQEESVVMPPISIHGDLAGRRAARLVLLFLLFGPLWFISPILPFSCQPYKMLPNCCQAKISPKIQPVYQSVCWIHTGFSDGNSPELKSVPPPDLLVLGGPIQPRAQTLVSCMTSAWPSAISLPFIWLTHPEPRSP
jgi:hypothetical protein